MAAGETRADDILINVPLATGGSHVKVARATGGGKYCSLFTGGGTKLAGENLGQTLK